MSVTKDIIETENNRTSENRGELHLHTEGTFMRAYGWSAWLACRYLNDFKVTKRQFKGIEQPVTFIGFPATSLSKWIPEGAEQLTLGEKHLVVRLPGMMISDGLEQMAEAYAEWTAAIPLMESQGQRSKNHVTDDFRGSPSASLTSVMQRVLGFPIESKSPLECMAFLADIKQQLSHLF